MSCLLAAALLTPAAPHAAAAVLERPSMPESAATLVVTGTVTKAFARDAGSYAERITAVKVDAVERQSAERPGRVEPGDTVYVYTFALKPDAGFVIGAGGHAGAPPEGARVRVRVHGTDGVNEGLYPRWFETLPAGGAGAAPR